MDHKTVEPGHPQLLDFRHPADPGAAERRSARHCFSPGYGSGCDSFSGHIGAGCGAGYNPHSAFGRGEGFLVPAAAPASRVHCS